MQVPAPYANGIEADELVNRDADQLLDEREENKEESNTETQITWEQMINSGTLYKHGSSSEVWKDIKDRIIQKQDAIGQLLNKIANDGHKQLAVEAEANKTLEQESINNVLVVDAALNATENHDKEGAFAE